MKKKPPNFLLLDGLLGKFYKIGDFVPIVLLKIRCHIRVLTLKLVFLINKNHIRLDLFLLVLLQRYVYRYSNTSEHDRNLHFLRHLDERC